MRQKTIETWVKENNVPDIDYLTDKALNYDNNKDWYINSKLAIEKVFKDRTKLFIDILAATSQQNTVEQNFKYAIDAFKRVISGQSLIEQKYGIADHIIKKNIAYARYNWELSGPKISAFARALNGDKNSIVIDTWMLKVFNIKRHAPTKCDRKFISEYIEKIADKIGWANCEVQAALWAYGKVELSDKDYYKDYSDYSKYLENYKDV